MLHETQAADTDWPLS